MAQNKPVIKSIEEATCLRCVFAYLGGDRVICHREYVGQDEVREHDFCGMGQWLVYMGNVKGMNPVPDACGLEDVYEWFTE